MKNLKRIRSNAIRILYCDDWYDGPISGLCEYKGKYYHFGWTDEDYKTYKDEDGEILSKCIRKYTVWKLPFDRLIYELMWHLDFSTNVNPSFTYDDKMKSSELFKKRCDFYKRREKEYKKLGKPPDLEPIGYFVETY